MPCDANAARSSGRWRTREDAAVNLRVERFDPAVHHFGETGYVGHRDDRVNPRLPAPWPCRPSTPAPSRDRPAPWRRESGRFCQKHSVKPASGVPSPGVSSAIPPKLSVRLTSPSPPLEFPADVGRASVLTETATCGLYFCTVSRPWNRDRGQCGGYVAILVRQAVSMRITGKVKWFNNAKGTDSLNARAVTTSSCTSRRFRAPVSGRSKKASKSNSKSSTVPRTAGWQRHQAVLDR
jgi:hypothetical protein